MGLKGGAECRVAVIVVDNSGDIAGNILVYILVNILGNIVQNIVKNICKGGNRCTMGLTGGADCRGLQLLQWISVF